MNKKSPMIQFKVPEKDFIQMVKNNEIVLGTELPKSAHKSFHNKGYFEDNLTRMPYLGNEEFGLEFEIRARRKARNKMANYFDGSVKIEDLSNDRIDKIKAAYKRMIVNDPHKRSELLKEMNKRIETVQMESKVLQAAKTGENLDDVDKLVKELSKRTREISHTSREAIGDIVKKQIDAKKYLDTLTCLTGGR